MNPYLLDTNFFIQAHRIGFPMDVVPSFWNKVRELAEAGKIISIEKVREEIYRVEDELKEWCVANLPDSFFKDSTGVMEQYAHVVGWAYSKLNDPYSQSALDTFLNAEEADAWIVAFAHANQIPIVTHEVSAPDSKKNIKIPDACQPFAVRTVQPMSMFRELGERF